MMSKIEYELYLRAQNHRNPTDTTDLETVDFEPCVNYRDAVKQAKEISKMIPYINRYGEEIKQVQVAAYISDEEEEYGTSYYLLWKETYENGRGCGRLTYNPL